jgi:low affinity Fe/Cu permease
MVASKLFTRFSNWVAQIAGRPIALGYCLAVILAWVLGGPLFGSRTPGNSS